MVSVAAGFTRRPNLNIFPFEMFASLLESLLKLTYISHKQVQKARKGASSFED